MTNAALVLEDGSIWAGRGFGACRKVSGEVVFNTGMVGYVQSISDPSYRGQILCQTYPLVGNYGVNPDEYESEGPQITGHIVSELCESPSHYTSRMTLDEWLKKSGVPGITGIDTRELTKVLRLNGTMLGILEVGENCVDTDRLQEEVKQVLDPNQRDLVGEVSIKSPQVYPAHSEAFSYLAGLSLERYKEEPRWTAQNSIRIVVLDCGVKHGIIRSLQVRGADVIRVPAGYGASNILALSPDGILVSNGPGDPKKAEGAADALRGLAAEKIPIFGVCLGNQILALALGCDTYKLKFGHRGQNHPALEKSTGRVVITSQNHGFAVHPDSVAGTDLEITFTNGNDGTVEGIAHRTLPVSAVQFHPEARPGPLDTGYLFDNFLNTIKGNKR